MIPGPPTTAARVPGSSSDAAAWDEVSSSSASTSIPARASRATYSERVGPELLVTKAIRSPASWSRRTASGEPGMGVPANQTTPSRSSTQSIPGSLLRPPASATMNGCPASFLSLASATRARTWHRSTMSSARLMTSSPSPTGWPSWPEAPPTWSASSCRITTTRATATWARRPSWTPGGTAGSCERDGTPGFYGYRMRFADPAGGPRQTLGVIGALELEPPGTGILPHEETTPKAKTDRLELLRATSANLSPIWGLAPVSGLSSLLHAARSTRRACHGPRPGQPRDVADRRRRPDQGHPDPGGVRAGR